VTDATPPEEDRRPNLVKLFDKIGLVKGARYQTVTLSASPLYIGPVVVETIVGSAGADGQVAEAVIVFSEPGTNTVHRVRWSEIGRLTTVD